MISFGKNVGDEEAVIRGHKFIDGKLLYLVNEEWRDLESISCIAFIRNYWHEKEHSINTPLDPNSKILFVKIDSNHEKVYGVLMNEEIHLFSTEEILKFSPNLLIDYFEEHFTE